MDNWLNTQCSVPFALIQFRKLLTSLGIFRSPDLHALLCIEGSEEVNQRYPIKNDATLLVVTGRGLLGLPRFMLVGD